MLNLALFILAIRVSDHISKCSQQYKSSLYNCRAVHSQTTFLRPHCQVLSLKSLHPVVWVTAATWTNRHFSRAWGAGGLEALALRVCPAVPLPHCTRLQHFVSLLPCARRPPRHSVLPRCVSTQTDWLRRYADVPPGQQGLRLGAPGEVG